MEMLQAGVQNTSVTSGKLRLTSISILHSMCSQQFEKHTLFCLRAPFSFMCGQSFPVTTAFISATGTALKRKKIKSQKIS